MILSLIFSLKHIELTWKSCCGVWVQTIFFKVKSSQTVQNYLQKNKMNHHSLSCVVFILLIVYNSEIIEAIPQLDMIISNSNSGGFAQYNPYHQRSIEEFSTVRSSDLNQNDEPCVPQQFFPPRSKRSANFKNNMLRPVYPVNTYGQNINNNPVVNKGKPPYNTYGGYYCGNQESILQPERSNNTFWSYFSHIFGGAVEPSTTAAPMASESETKPVNEDNDHNNNPNEVIILLRRYLISLK